MSKRFNLREYQQQVLDRLQALAASSVQTSTLGVRIGNAFWLIDMTDISEVLPLPALTTVPLTKPWYCGVANVRGNLYSIIDLGAFMGGNALIPESQNRIMLLGQTFGFNAGLLVTRVLGLRNAQDWQQIETGDEIRYQDSNGQQWRKFDLKNLLNQPEFLQIGI